MPLFIATLSLLSNSAISGLFVLYFLVSASKNDVKLACISRSNNNILFSFDILAAKLNAVVVFPVPPFKFHTVIIFIIDSFL